MITEAEFELLVRRSLENGVPSGIVSAIFGLDEAVVKRVRTDVLVKAYGTADQAEYLEWVEWKTLERCYQIVEHGTPAEVSRVATTVLGRQIARRSKATGETQRATMEELAQAMEEMRTGTAPVGEPSRFVVTAPEGE